MDLLQHSIHEMVWKDREDDIHDDNEVDGMDKGIVLGMDDFYNDDDDDHDDHDKVVKVIFLMSNRGGEL